MTSEPAAAQNLGGLARLRRVRERIDGEYAQPLDVEALARTARDGGDALVRGETVTRPIRNREAPVTGPRLA